MRYFIRFILLSGFLFNSISNFAQQTRLSDHNSIGWINFFATIPVSNIFGVHAEMQNRRVEGIKNLQQTLYRTGFNVQIHPDVLFRIGAAYVITFPYGDYPLNAFGKKTQEYRCFQMIQLNQRIRKTELTHRFMLEQRWNGKFSKAELDEPDTWPFSNRARYMIRLQQPLDKAGYYYVGGFNELFIGFGKNVGENIFDQNRFSLLIGNKISRLLRVECGYLAQTLQLSREINSSNVFQYNKGFIVNTYLNLGR